MQAIKSGDAEDIPTKDFTQTPGVEFDDDLPMGAAARGMSREEYNAEYDKALAEEAKIARMTDKEFKAYNKQFREATVEAQAAPNKMTPK